MATNGVHAFYTERLINHGIDQLGTTRERILAVAAVMEACGLGDGITAVGQALQMIAAGGLEPWLASFGMGNGLEAEFGPRLRAAYAEASQ